MTRSKLFTATAALAAFSGLTAATTSPATASHCGMDNYDHNGSTMEVTFCDYSMHIAYDDPRPAMRRNGVAPGTLLIDAKTFGHGHVKGNARVFKRGCGDLMYKVSGRINGERIELYGMAPVRDSDCSIVRFRKDRLVFEKM
jgi:hypothetical protein